jgi:hypothetical protein
MNEELLGDRDFPFYEYDKYMRAKKYPLMVLSFVGARDANSPKYETLWWFGNIPEEIQAMRAKALRRK